MSAEMPLKKKSLTFGSTEKKTLILPLIGSAFELTRDGLRAAAFND